MADTIQFELVSPERRLASTEARQVQLPGAEGDMTAMPDHAPTITTLRPGIVTVTATDGATARYAVTGGFAQIDGDSVSVLAERAFVGKPEERPALEAFLQEARAQAAEAPAEHKDAAELLVADTVQLLEDMV